MARKEATRLSHPQGLQDEKDVAKADAEQEEEAENAVEETSTLK